MPKRPRDECGPASIASLPEDLLSTVFSHLDVAGRLRAGRVCRRWRAAALQPPHSTALKLRVLRADHAGPSGGVLPTDAAAAVLRAPHCAGLRRLSLASASALSYSLAAIWGVYVDQPKRQAWREVLGRLDLASSAPLLEELELDSASSLLLSELDLAHPSLRRLGARFAVERDGSLAPALRRLPRLRVLGCLEVEASSLFEALCGLRAERLELRDAAPCEAHTRLLLPGGALALAGCSWPGGKAWSLPAGLAELRLEDCSLSPALFETLLCRTELHAPGLRKLVIRSSCLGQIRPRDLIAALRRVPGGTQIEIGRPHGAEWREPTALAPLMRTLAVNTTLHRCVHMAVAWEMLRFLQPRTIAEDYASYLKARVVALWGMGEAGRRLLAEQGYGFRLPA